MASTSTQADSSLPPVTPSQLCLLALVQFYLAEGATDVQPSAPARADNHTTRWILQLISDERRSSASAISLQAWLHAVRQQDHARRRVQPATVEHALQAVESAIQAIASPHDLRTLLHTAFSHVTEYDTANTVDTTHKKVDRWSVLGVFIRQCYVPVELGGFQALADLFDEVLAFQQASASDDTASIQSIASGSNAYKGNQQ